MTDFDSLWNYGDPAATEAAFRALLPEARARWGAARLAELLSQIARTHSLRAQFAPAHALLDEAEAMLGEGMGVARARVLMERGRCYNSAGEPAHATPVFEAALAAARSAGADYHAVDAAHMLGIAAPPEAAMAWNQRAMEMAEASADPRARGWLGPLYNNLAWTFFGMDRFGEALALQEKSRAFRAERGQRVPTRIAEWGIARTMRAMGRDAEALAGPRALLASAPEGAPRGYVYEELGELALSAGEGAADWFGKAHAILSKDTWLARNESDRLARLLRLSQST